MLAPVRVTAPEILPVSLAEAKVHLRVDPDATLEDSLVEGLIRAAVDHLDGWTGLLGRCLVEQTWRQDFEAGTSRLQLPLGPVIDVISVTADGTPVDPASYSLSTDGGGRSFVTVDSGIGGAITVTYRAGYATIPQDDGPPVVPARSTVPQSVKQAILLFVGAWYENREETAIGVSVAGLPGSVAAHALLAPYRRIGI
ncbi:head-tail connector protein [Mesorhizobium sp. SP-1A]|uniref:head-tail connector protein n=1 Tax=Mesorhizobium sp. SP-1A TaxID=3077840 RepID=UPI0028F71D9C|nr:head-tail connector protein [Mesorhizobium sp. SP-1A]